MKPARHPLTILLSLGLTFVGCVFEDEGVTRVTISGSAVGAEADILRRQLEAFQEEHPDVRVEIRPTPDAADQRHQLYVQWLVARSPDPDILQLDVIWTAEFAAAGWILPLSSFDPPTDAFFDATIRANLWQDALYAVPWFVDVGMLYWRSDLLDSPPSSYGALLETARTRSERIPHGFVWQGARYEGLVVTFLEHLRAFGGRVLEPDGRVRVDSEEAVRALTFMRDAIYAHGAVPEAALTWQEEQTRLDFQSGRALFMRNWPYAYPLMQDSSASEVAGRFDVAPLPAGPGAEGASALGGAQLAVNAHSDEPAAAWRVVAFLTGPEQMLERARGAGQYPARRDLYDRPELADALPVDPERARSIIEAAVPRPVTPVYTQLSSILQIALHRVLTRQREPAPALREAADEMRALLERVELRPGASAERSDDAVPRASESDAARADAPAAIADPPAATTDAPAATTDPPAATTDAPAPTTDPPAPTAPVSPSPAAPGGGGRMGV
ncbi:MAG: ABC transporter substrate-binding protein [Longimicrobiales bacterium]|nr:ABC transporter substrate-binding protein [Longimicrobiales bacterium]